MDLVCAGLEVTLGALGEEERRVRELVKECLGGIVRVPALVRNGLSRDGSARPVSEIHAVVGGRPE
jgi:hypothetical protein